MISADARDNIRSFVARLATIEEIEFTNELMRRRWHELDVIEGARLLAALKVGDAVSWPGKRGRIVAGTIRRLLARSVICFDGLVEWRVHPRTISVLPKSEEAK